MPNYNFVNSELLYLLCMPILIMIWHIIKHKENTNTILFSATKNINTKEYFRNILNQKFN